MSSAQCACGALCLTFNRPPQLTAICHCLACQRRTGSSFSVNAFYEVEAVEIVGTTVEFVRSGDSGGKVRMHFCPTCGSTVFWKAEASPAWIGVAVGAFAEPAFTPPAMSVFEQTKHGWVRLDEAMARFEALP